MVKPWFFEGYGLFIQPRVSNFDPTSTKIKFILFWIQLPTLPLEYRVMGIVEIIDNKMCIL